jgi:hypothetical protein
VAAISIFEYLLAADGLVNFEYRLEKMITFSRRSITYIHEKWGIPEPFNVGVFGILSIISIVVFKKILARIMGGNKTISDSSKYRFNMPDLSEIGVIANKIKTISEDIKELKNLKQASQAE